MTAGRDRHFKTMNILHNDSFWRRLWWVQIALGLVAVSCSLYALCK